MQPLQRNTSWTAHLREARLSGSTPGLHRTPSAPAEVQDEYDPELPDLDPEEYDPEEPALALSGVHKEEYDPEEPALERVSSLGDEEYDPAKPATVSSARRPVLHCWSRREHLVHRAVLCCCRLHRKNTTQSQTWTQRFWDHPSTATINLLQLIQSVARRLVRDLCRHEVLRNPMGKQRSPTGSTSVVEDARLSATASMWHRNNLLHVTRGIARCSTPPVLSMASTEATVAPVS